MTKDTVVAFRATDGFSPDPLTDLLRRGARDLIAQAVETEMNDFPTAHADQTDASGRRRLARHGHLPEREVQTGIGAVPVKVPACGIGRHRAGNGSSPRQPDREHLRNRPAPNHQDQGLPRPPDGIGDDPPADAVRQEEMAQARRAQPPAQIIEGLGFRDGIKREIKAA